MVLFCLANRSKKIMSQLASQFRCENLVQLVAFLVVQWNLQKATKELLDQVERIDSSQLPLNRKVSAINELKSQFQSTSEIAWCKKAPPWSFFLAFSSWFYILRICFWEYIHLLFFWFLGVFLYSHYFDYKISNEKISSYSLRYLSFVVQR